MEYSERWEILRDEPLGSGGQGPVYLVFDKTSINIAKYPSDHVIRSRMDSILKKIKATVSPMQFGDIVEDFTSEISNMIDKKYYESVTKQDPSNYGALKILHKPEDARDPERAEERMIHEIDAMARLSHPNLMKLIDVDLDYKWYVMKYYSRGTLENLKDYYTGNFDCALRDFLKLLNGVSSIHKEGLVHRDIKPENVFIDDDGAMVLSDFGLVYELDESGERLSGSQENVGTHAWMPPCVFRTLKFPKMSNQIP